MSDGVYRIGGVFAMPRFVFSMAWVALVAASGSAQSIRYWPQLEIGFPVPASALEGSQKPVKFRLCAATGNGRFERVSELAADRLQPIPNRRPGFLYTARGDGDEEFALQMVYADGTVSPTDADLRGDTRVVFDTKPPTASVQPLGANGVQWTISDDNLETASIRLECRWVGESSWHPVSTKTFAARDEYTWASLAKDTRILEVRLQAKDKAGHESVSRVIKLPDGGSNRPGTPAMGSNEPIRNSEDIPNAQSQIVYVNRRDMTVRTKLTHITRSGVAKVHLFVKDYATGAGSEWKSDKSQTCDIRFDAANTTVEMPFVAPKDGRYGFIVIPESGVQRREPDPRASTPPQHLVEVDTVTPVVKVRNVQVSPGANGPRVEIEWDADDRNLMPDPIVLEYAAEKNALTWTSIAEKIPNSRRYVWEVTDKTMFKLYVRARATDKATNVGEHVYEQAVVIDLDKPSATIDNIRGSGSPLPSSSSDKPGTPPPLGTSIALPSIIPGVPKAPELPPIK